MNVIFYSYIYLIQHICLLSNPVVETCMTISFGQTVSPMGMPRGLICLLNIYCWFQNMQFLSKFEWFISKCSLLLTFFVIIRVIQNIYTAIVNLCNVHVILAEKLFTWNFFKILCLNFIEFWLITFKLRLRNINVYINACWLNVILKKC